MSMRTRLMRRKMLVDEEDRVAEEEDEDYDPNQEAELANGDESDGDDWGYVDSDNEVQDKFGTNVDENAEFVGNTNYGGAEDDSEEDSEIDAVSEDLRSIASSDESNQESERECSKKNTKKKFKQKFPVFNEETDMKDVVFKFGMEFKDHEVFRDATKKYVILRDKQITFTKNGKEKVSAKCKDGCPWSIYGSFVLGVGNLLPSANHVSTIEFSLDEPTPPHLSMIPPTPNKRTKMTYRGTNNMTYKRTKI